MIKVCYKFDNKCYKFDDNDISLMIIKVCYYVDDKIVLLNWWYRWVINSLMIKGVLIGDYK